MDTCFDRPHSSAKSQELVHCLRKARNKLTPVIDHIITATLDLIRRGHDNIVCEQILTSQQYQDVIWAFRLMQEVEYDVKHEKHAWPNTDVIVQNVDVLDKNVFQKDKPVVIDGETILELLEIYERMGVIIQRIVTEPFKPDKSSPPVSEIAVASSRGSSDKSILQNKASIERSAESGENDHANDGSSYSGENDADVNPPQRKSTLSALLSGSSGDIGKGPSQDAAQPDTKPNEECVDARSEECDEDTTVFIRIQCFSECSDPEHENAAIGCTKNCPSHYHVKLNGEPVTLKVNQINIEDGRVYCINTGSDDENEIRIAIKQCPECKSTVIGSSAKLSDDNLGESHESITLHGKGGDEANMTFSSDEDMSQQPSAITPVRTSDADKRSQRTIDVVIDADNVDKSTIKIREASEEEANVTDLPGHEPLPPSSISLKSSSDHVREKQVRRTSLITKSPERIPLTRRKICSSMEFDVTKTPTRLREQELQHKNAQIVLELKEMGVDQILRACRPAKCCRKAILNERQKTALPYCVSFRSLPLMGNDVEVIKQSIDMSVKKIKNSLDLTQAYKDKLAFYVNLGRNEFRPNSNQPWVVPVYDIKYDPTVDNRISPLENTAGIPKKLKSTATLITLITERDKHKNERKRTVDNTAQKYFILKKPANKLRHILEESHTVEIKRRVGKTKRRRQFRNITSVNGQDGCCTKIFKCKQTENIFKEKKKSWSNLHCENWRVAQQSKILGFCCVETRMRCFSEPASKVSLHTAGSSSHLTNFPYFKNICSLLKKPDLCGDQPVSSLTNILDKYFQECKKDVKIHTNDQIKSRTSVDGTVSSPAFIDDLPEFNFTENMNHNSRKRQQSKKTTQTHTKPFVVSDRRKNSSEQDVQNHGKKTIHVNELFPKLKVNSDCCERASNEVFHASEALTNIRIKMNKVEKSGQQLISKGKKLGEDGRKCASKSKSRNHLKKKLEYFVDLVNGDLLWSKAFPLLPQRYNAYYNYDNEKAYNQKSTVRVEESPNAQNESSANPEIIVEEPVVVQRVTREEARRVPTPTREVQPETRRSTLSEMDLALLEFKRENRNLEEAPKKTLQSAHTLPPQYSSFPMGPEDRDAPWAPHVVSQISLPQIQEEPVQKQEMAEVETAPMDELEPAEPEKKPCVCAKSKCTKSKECVKRKSCRSKNIRISIKKTRKKDAYELKPKPCSKEVCELYKNSKMVSNQPNTSKSKGGDRCETLTITAKDAMEIYINDQKICVTNKNKKTHKSEKPTKTEKPQ